MFLNGPTPVSFSLFSLFSSTNFTEKIVEISRIQTRIVRRQTRWPLDHHHSPNQKIVFAAEVEVKTISEMNKKAKN